MSDQQERIEKLEAGLAQVKEALAFMRQLSASQDRRLRILEDQVALTVPGNL